MKDLCLDLLGTKFLMITFNELSYFECLVKPIDLRSKVLIKSLFYSYERTL